MTVGWLTAWDHRLEWKVGAELQYQIHPFSAGFALERRCDEGFVGGADALKFDVQMFDPCLSEHKTF